MTTWTGYRLGARDRLRGAFPAMGLPPLFGTPHTLRGLGSTVLDALRRSQVTCVTMHDSPLHPRERPTGYEVSSWRDVEPYTPVLGQDGQVYDVLRVAGAPGSPTDDSGWPLYLNVTLISPDGSIVMSTIPDSRPCVVARPGELEQAVVTLVAAFGRIERIS